MPRFLSLLVVAVGLVVGLAPAKGQVDWLPVEGSYSGTVDFISRLDDRVFVGNRYDDGVFYSQDGFGTWGRVDLFDRMLSRVSAAYKTPDGVLFISAGSWLLRSLDGGLSWDEPWIAPEFSVIIEHDGVLWGGTSYDYGILPINEDQDWTSPDLFGTEISDALVYNDVLYVAARNSNNGDFPNGVYSRSSRTSDWELIGRPPLGLDVNGISIWNDILIAATENGLWTFSFDTGDWAHLETPYQTSVARDVTVYTNDLGEEVLYPILGGLYVFETSDLREWNSIGPQLPDQGLAIEVVENKLVVGLFQEGIVELDASQRPNPIGSWKSIGLPISYAFDFAQGRDEIVIGSFRNTGLWASTDDGASWSHVAFSGTGGYGDVEIGHDGTWYVGLGNNLFYSDDSGQTWQGSELEHIKTFSVSPEGWVIATVPYCSGCATGVYRSWRGEEPWTFLGHAYAREAQFVDGALYVAQCVDNAWEGKMLVSRDFGTTWRETQILGCPDRIAYADGVVYALLHSNQSGFHVARSFDSYETVEYVAKIPISHATRIESGPNGAVYVSDRLNLYVSSDYGDSWEVYGAGIPHSGDSHCQISGLRQLYSGHVLAGTVECGTFRSSRPFVVPVSDPPELPIGATGLIAAPNPVQAGQSVEILIENQGPVDIVLFDALGRRMGVFQDQQYHSNGYTLRVPDALTSGVYFVHIIADGSRSVSAIVVLN